MSHDTQNATQQKAHFKTNTEILRGGRSRKHWSMCVKRNIKGNRWGSEKDKWREMNMSRWYHRWTPAVLWIGTTFCIFQTLLFPLTSPFLHASAELVLPLSLPDTNLCLLTTFASVLLPSLFLKPPSFSCHHHFICLSHSLPLSPSWCPYQNKGQLRSYEEDILVTPWCAIIWNVQHLLFAAAASAL